MAGIEERELTLGRATLDAYADLLARMGEARGVVAAVRAPTSTSSPSPTPRPRA